MSEEDEYEGFCPHCGAKLRKGTAYCQDCGSVVNAAEATQSQNTQYQNNSNSGKDLSGRLTLVTVLLGLYTALVIVMGISVIVSTDSIMNALTTSADWPSIVQQFRDLYGWDEAQTIDMFRSTLGWLGYYMIGAGVVGIIGCVCGIMKKFWALGLIMYIIATVMMAMTIIGLIVGVLVTYYYSTTKPVFTN
jgi:hypothetical protein